MGQQSAVEWLRIGTKVIGSHPFYKTVYEHNTFNQWFDKFKNK